MRARADLSDVVSRLPDEDVCVLVAVARGLEARRAGEPPRGVGAKLAAVAIEALRANVRHEQAIAPPPDGGRQ